jgi:ketosteroid isomerase-like protein
MKRRTLLKLMGAAMPASCLPGALFAQEKPKPAVSPPSNCQAFGYPIAIPPVPQPRMLPGEPALTPAQAADVLSIQRLQMTYGQLHDQGTADEVAALFHPDAKLYCLYIASTGFEGRQQIRDWYAWWFELYVKNGEYNRHRPVNQVIDLDGDLAYSHSILLAEGAPRDKQQWNCFMGRYVHQLIRHDGGWLFYRSWIIVHGSWVWPGRKRLVAPVPHPFTVS